METDRQTNKHIKDQTDRQTENKQTDRKTQGNIDKKSYKLSHQIFRNFLHKIDGIHQLSDDRREIDFLNISDRSGQALPPAEVQFDFSGLGVGENASELEIRKSEFGILATTDPAVHRARTEVQSNGTFY